MSITDHAAVKAAREKMNAEAKRQARKRTAERSEIRAKDPTVKPSAAEADILAYVRSLPPGVPIDVVDAAAAIRRPADTVRIVVRRMIQFGWIERPIAVRPRSRAAVKAETRDQRDARAVAEARAEKAAAMRAPRPLPRAPKPGTANLGSLVMLHGPGVLNQDDPRKQKDKT